MTDKKEALYSAGKEGITEFVKMVPGLNVLIGGVQAYQENIAEQQRRAFVEELKARLVKLEQKTISINSEWYRTPEGVEVTKKIVATAMNAEYVDKISYFVNALLNSSEAYDQDERLKFIEILRQVSKPALKVLAKEHQLQRQRDQHHSPQVLSSELVSKANVDPYLAETCITELYSLGVFSSTIEFDPNGRQRKNFEQGIPAYTEFTKKFIEFISDPKEI